MRPSLVIIWVLLQNIYGFTHNFNYASRSRLLASPDFEKLISTLERTNIASEAVQVVKDFINSGDSISSKSLTSCMKIYGLAALVDDAMELLHTAKERGLLVNSFHYNTLLQICSKHKRLDNALELFEEMKASEIPLDAFTYTNMFAVYGQLQDKTALMDLYKSAPNKHKDDVFYASLFLALEKCQGAAECEQALTAMRAEGIRLSLGMYASLIRIHKTTGPKRSYEYFLECERVGLYPNRVMVLNLLDVLKSSRQMEIFQAVKRKYASLLERGQDYVYKTDIKAAATVSFNDLIAQAKATGNYTEALAFSDRWLATQKTLTPGGLTSCIVIYGLAKQPRKALELLETLRRRGVQPNIMHYNAVMSSCSRGGLYDEALQVFLAIDPSLAKDEFTHGVVLSVFEKQGDWQAALNLFNELRSSGALRSTVMYNTLLSALGKSGQWEKAYTLFEELLATGKPDKVSYYTIVTALEANDQFELAAVLRQQYLGGQTPVPRSVSDAGSLQNKLVQQQGGGLFQLLFAMGELQKCLQVLRESEEAGVTPHISHYHSVMRFCGETGNWEQALEIYDRMRARGVVVDKKLYAQLLHVLREFADGDVVERVLRESESTSSV